MNRWVNNPKVQINITLEYDKAMKLIFFTATQVVRNECANAIIIPQHLILSLKPTIENPAVHLNNALTCKDFSRYIHSLSRNTGQTRSGIQAVSIPYALSFRLARNVAFDRQNRGGSSHYFPVHPRHFLAIPSIKAKNDSVSRPLSWLSPCVSDLQCLCHFSYWWAMNGTVGKTPATAHLPCSPPPLPYNSIFTGWDTSQSPISLSLHTVVPLIT